MINYGFIKVSAAIPFGKIADIEYNKKQIISLINESSKNNSSIVVFPELTITSYTCGDLFGQEKLINESLNALVEITNETKEFSVLSIIGLPVINNNNLYNCAAVINKGKILGIIPKSFIPGYKEFYEPRWFSSGKTGYDPIIKINNLEVKFGTDFLFVDNNNTNFKVGVEICEDLWTPVPPSSLMALAGAVILCNLSASNSLVAKNEYRRELVKNQSARCLAGYIYASSGMGESTTDVVFDADAIISENGIVIAESQRFLRKNQIISSEIDIEKLVFERTKLNTFENSNIKFDIIEFESNQNKFSLSRIFDIHPFVPSEKEKLETRCKEIFNIQASGLARRIESIKDCKTVIGVSGGLDSTLALLVIIKSYKILGKNTNDIIAVTMPGFGTTDRTYKNASQLCKLLNVNFKEISIKDISNLMYKEIGHNPEIHDVTYENIQARARTYILMSIANEENGIVIGTGDLSEIALGWSTYNGDHISMYNVNSSIPKTLVKFLVAWVSENEFDKEIRNILLDIIDQPISPELLPSDGKNISQKTEDKIGPYELHDFFLYYFIRFGFSAEKILFLAKYSFKDKYDEETIKKWLKIFFKRFFSNQWKRDCVPAGPKVGSIDLSPRGSWRMPSEAEVDLFLKNL